MAWCRFFIVVIFNAPSLWASERASFRSVQLIGVIRESEDQHLSVALVRYSGSKTATLKIGDACPWDKTFFLSKINTDELTFDSGKDIETVGRSPWSNTAKYEDSEEDGKKDFHESEVSSIFKSDDIDDERKDERSSKLDIPLTNEKRAEPAVSEEDDTPASIEELIELLSVKP